MGGYGSGQWHRWNSKDTTESCHAVDVRYLHRHRLLQPGHTFSLRWTRGKRETGTISGMTLADSVTLVYRSRRRECEEWEEVQERIPLEWTPCHYGGARPWFRCPGKSCGRRVALVYGAGKYFVCRYCYGLVYASSNEGPRDSALRKAQKIRKRLGGSGGMMETFPWKPKGMHWATYQRLREQGLEADLTSWETLKASMDKMDAVINRMAEKQAARRPRPAPD